MTIHTSKDSSSNLTTLSNEYSYIINKKNGIIYFSTEKGVSIEYVVDKLMNPLATGVFIYENLDNDEISLIFINSTKDSIEFNIQTEFSVKQVENSIKLSCFQNNVSDVYFLENSKVEKNINLPSCFSKNFIEKAVLKRALRKAPQTKNNQSKIIMLIAFLIVTGFFEFGVTKAFSYLNNTSIINFNKHYSFLENKRNVLKEELEKYEHLSQNLKGIQVELDLQAYLAKRNKGVQ